MKKEYILGSIALIIIAGLLGWFFGAQRATAPITPQEEQTTQQQEETTQQPTLNGTWRSTQDSRFIRTFRTNGTVTDAYTGDDSATIQGTWEYVVNARAERPELPDVGDMHVLKISFDEEVLYFGVSELTPSNLALIFLSGNGTLTFERVP